MIKLIFLFLFISTSAFSVHPLVSDATPLSPRTSRATKAFIEGEFPNFYALIPEERRLELLQKSFASILGSLRVPYVMPDAQELQYDKFFDRIQNMVVTQDPGAKVYIAGGMVRSLLGFVYYKLYKGFEKTIAKSLANNNAKFSVQETVINTMNKLIKNEGKINQETFESQPKTRQFLKALGINSDFDILIDFSPTMDSTQKQSIINSVTDFINSAEKFLNLRDEKDIKKSIIPIGDVKEYEKQLGEVGDRSAVNQGGLSLDWLAFDVKNHDFRHPEGKPEILENFLNGILTYLPAKNDEKSSDKQIVRALRPLLEVPAAKYDPESEKRMIAALTQLGEQSSVETAAGEQKDKMMRNARFGSAHNRFADPKTKLDEKAKSISGKLQTTEGSAALATEFLPSHPIAFRTEDKGELQKNNILIDMETFFKDYTDKGIVYHGTSDIANVLNMIRNGFVVSKEDQGLSVYGSGFYTTKSRALAESYAKNAGIIIPISIKNDPQIRIIDLSKDLAKSFVDNVKHQNPGKDINQILANQYDIDIVINEHNIVQNAAILKMNKDVKTIIEAELSSIALKINQLKRLDDLYPIDRHDKNRYQIMEDQSWRYNSILATINRWISFLNPDQGLTKLYKILGGTTENNLYQKFIKLTENFFITNKKIATKENPDLMKWATDNNLPEKIKLAIRKNQMNRDFPLEIALKRNKGNDVRALLENGADPNEYMDDGVRLLSYALDNDMTDSAKLLAENGAKLDLRDARDRIAVDKALKENQEDIVSAIIKNGTQVKHKDSSGRTLLISCIINYRFHKNPSLNFIKTLLENGADTNQAMEKDESLLFYAVRSELYELAELLLQFEAKPNAFTYSTSTVPLVEAVKTKQINMIELLLKNGADPNQRDGDSALVSEALRDQNMEIFNLFVKYGADTNQTIRGTPLIVFAVDKGDLKTTKLLVEKGASVDTKDSYGWPILLSASHNNNTELVTYLLDNKAEINTGTSSGVTALHTAAGRNALEAAKILVERGADVTAKNKDEETPLDVAIRNKAEKVATYLRSVMQ